MKQFLKVVAIAVLMFSAPVLANAQKIGHVNVDSVLKIWPKYQAVVDSLTRYQINAQKIAEGMGMQILAKRHEIDSMKGKDTPLIQQLRATQLAQLEGTYEQYITLAGEEVQMIQMQLVDTLYKELNAAIAKVAKAKGYTYVLDSSKGGQVMYANPADDIFLAVLAELKIPVPVKKTTTPAPGK